ncbi:hypothetical protein CMU99_16170 [Elizabethkingia anophelis]|nr:hypothetical protein [Elizabethkingia anophelis]
MVIYYKRIITYHKWPDNDDKAEDYVVFSLSKTKFDKNIIDGLRFRPDTSIKEKEDFLKERLNLKKVTVKKIL